MKFLKEFLGRLDLISKWNKLNSRERTLSLIVVGVILLLILDLAVIRPLWRYYVDLDEKIAVQEKKLMQNMLNITRKDLIEKHYDLYRELIHTPGTDEEETASMLREIEKLARTNEVVLVDMKPKEVKAFPNHKEYKVDLDCETEMPQLIRFLHQLESSQQIMRVQTANMQLKAKGATQIKAKMSITKVVLL